VYLGRKQEEPCSIEKSYDAVIRREAKARIEK
jgi:hypothetical protein